MMGLLVFAILSLSLASTFGQKSNNDSQQKRGALGYTEQNYNHNQHQQPYEAQTASYASASTPTSYFAPDVKTTVANYQNHYGQGRSAAPEPTVVYSTAAPAGQHSYQQSHNEVDVQQILAKVAANQKISYSKPQHSFASDVSSFSFASPSASYNNNGYLTQFLQQQDTGADDKLFYPAASTHQAVPEHFYQSPAAPTAATYQIATPNYHHAAVIQNYQSAVPTYHQAAVPVYQKHPAPVYYKTQAPVSSYQIPVGYHQPAAKSYAVPQVAYSQHQQYSVQHQQPQHTIAIFHDADYAQAGREAVGDNAAAHTSHAPLYVYPRVAAVNSGQQYYIVSPHKYSVGR